MLAHRRREERTGWRSGAKDVVVVVLSEEEEGEE